MPVVTSGHDGELSPRIVLTDEARTISAQHTFDPTQPGAPFTLGPNAAGQLVGGLNADLVDGQEASALIAESVSQARGKPNTLAAVAQMPKPVYVAHRGVPFAAPENTWAAFRIAQMLGAPVIETDVLPSRDGAIIVTHDHDLSLHWDITGDLREMSVADILLARSNDPAFADEHPPLLVDILRTPGRTAWHIEAKDAKQSTLERIAAEIVAHGLEGQAAASCSTAIGSAGFAAVKAAYPSVQLVAVHFSSTLPDLAALAAAGVSVIAINYNATESPFLDADFVAQAHALGLAVALWTIDTRAERDLVLPFGPDIIYTNNWPWVSGVQPPPLPFEDTWARRRIGSAWTARPSVFGHWTFPGGSAAAVFTNRSAHLVCVGAEIQPNPRSTRIKCTYTPRALNADATRWIGFEVCMQNDYAVESTFPVRPEHGGSYLVLLRQNGTMQISRLDPGQNETTITAQASDAMVLDTPIPFQIDITPTSITFTRLDTMASVSTNDTQYRGGLVALIANQTVGEFSAFSMTDITP